MKKLYFTLAFLGFTLFTVAQTPTGNSTEVGITEGELAVSLSGGATYAIPIAVPPGINGVVPQISLVYNSQAGNGMAGYGWNVSGVSSITRIPATLFHDSAAGAVDLTPTDRFALDGQRLLIKSGTSGVYGADGTVYETENSSNLKITSKGTNPNGAKYGPAYFIVDYPDGSSAYYGIYSNSSSLTEWGLEFKISPQGLRINYTYTFSNNLLNIASIQYGDRNAINQIQFIYKTRQRPEQSYVGGKIFINDKILSEIKVTTNNGVGFRNYKLEHDSTSLDYDRLTSITEKSGDNSKSYNPTRFDYEDKNITSDPITSSSTTSTLGLEGINYQTSAIISGDFDGDGKMDFALYPTGLTTKKKFWLFTNLKSGSFNSPSTVESGEFEEIFAATYLSDSKKMMPAQGITLVQKASGYSPIVNFNVYRNSVYGVGIDYSKQVDFPAREKCSDLTTVKAKKYLSGDFNGDGLTDVITIDTPIWNSCGQSSVGKAYFIDLDRRIRYGFWNEAGTIIDFKAEDKLEAFDVNGDGKTEILHFKKGSVTVYALDKNKQLILLWKTVDADIATNLSILPGDYNGDGKMDFIIPKAVSLYPDADNYAKFLSTGTGFVKSSQMYPFRNSGINITPGSQGGVNISNLIPLDFNGDGKTDMVHFRSAYGNVYDGGRITITTYRNKGTSGFSLTKEFDTNISKNIRSYPIPIFLSPNKNNQYLEVAAISDNSIYSFNLQKDYSKETLVSAITTGNGVKESITYSPLQQDPYEPFYTPKEFTETYPNIDIVTAPHFKIVTKLEKKSATTYKKQLFNYYGIVLNVQGLGFMGFRATMRTNWHDDKTALISYLSKNDISLRGANIENYSVLGYVSTDATPTTYITKSVLGYGNYISSNKVFTLNNTSIIEYSGLDNSRVETQKTYSFEGYENLIATTVHHYEGSTRIGNINTEITYENSPTGSGSNYYIGRPIKKIETGVNPFQNDETYTYTNNLLTKITKKLNYSYPNTIVEENIYDSSGNIIRKQIKANAFSRQTNYSYDPTGRFLIESTDVEGLATTYTYNSNGTLKSETNPYGLTTSYEYDSWFKKIKTTDYLGKSNKYIYSRSGEKTIVTTTGDDGSSTVETFDDLGRKERVSVKNIMGTFTNVDYLYDIYNRNYKTSEPYIGTSPTQWNSSQYDNYGRVIQNNSFTGKTTNISYSGLSTTVNDGTKTKTTTKNAIGHVTSVKETPGGTISYEYFTNGQLKESNYDGVKTTISLDRFGRKEKITDPSAGVYTYQYNDLGEITQETTPNGTTTYTLDNNGKLTQKTIVGTNTNSKTTYTYDPTTKLLVINKFEDLVNGKNTITTAYTYDNYKRINKTVETNSLGPVFTKNVTYDAFGRLENETSTAALLGKTSAKTIKNTYKNGLHWQMLDNATVLWQTNTVNARGQLLTANMNSGIIGITNAYDIYGYATQIKYDRINSSPWTIMTLYTVFDPKRGNLTRRTNSSLAWSESFKYDSLDRLIEFTNSQGKQETQTYDDRGRITKNNLGTYDYAKTDKPYQNTSITVTADALNYYSNRGEGGGVSESNEVVYNDDMEAGTGWGAVKHPNTNFYSYSVGGAHGGQKSLKLTNTNTSTIKQYVNSDKWIDINNAVATEYTFSAWVFTKTSQGEVLLIMKKEAETTYATRTENIVTTSASYNKWVQITKTVLIPANIRKLNIRLDHNGQGDIWFDDVQITKKGSATINKKELNISYNTFKSPVQIEEIGVDKLSFVYNDSNDRSVMYYGGLQVDKLQRPLRKYYSADGSMEIKQNTVTGILDFVSYIGGDGYSAPLALKSNGTTQNYLYLHRDYQGSILLITDQTATVLEKRLFDAWGNIVKVENGSGIILKGLTLLDRGYTGHEHLQSVGLVNMNGRLYDAKLHRFLQPDNYVQDPSNTQNFNRYGYCWNNPLKYTDPSGEIIPLVVGVAIIVVSATINVYNNWSDITGGTGKFSDIKWGKFAGYTASGAISGALTAYGGPYGVVWAGGAQSYLNSATRGEDLGTMARNTVGGLIGGIASYGIGLNFDSTFTNGLIGGNNIYNSAITATTREIASNFVGTFSSNYWNTKGDFDYSLKTALDPISLGMSAVGGGLTGALGYKTQSGDIPYSPPILKNNLELRIMPYYIPNPSIVIPNIPLPPRTVVPPSFYTPKVIPK
ncbi:RHS repeat-associated core domain-containing protein [Flavobacterium sp. PL02]|uniref:RHS repeat-associated core domain-containing protein n=1 Tax=Flavobacterium sp. PL02 TaxID=3088354 RepID=UPI002B234502|nr:RHS repeat-associated core domain-containing protein [Flavobacterium sp. PL02]MEA9413813.1 RHS repeat-associated core domain-containing protein [Flavobacterium sp. PL02]